MSAPDLIVSVLALVVIALMLGVLTAGIIDRQRTVIGLSLGILALAVLTLTSIHLTPLT